MMNIKSLQSFTDLVLQLENEKIPFEQIKNSSTVIVPIPDPEKEWICYIRWEPIPGVIQFIQVLPVKVPETQQDEMRTILNRINFDLPVLGFVLNEKNGILTYRVQIFLDKNKSIPAEIIGGLMALSVHTVKAYLPQIKAAMMPRTRESIKSIFEL
jgi:hypothetical protein